MEGDVQHIGASASEDLAQRTNTNYGPENAAMSDNKEPIEDAGEEMDVQEISGWAEFCAWSGFVMTPIIWWLQGPSVSTDQFVVRTGLIVISASVAVGLRGRALFQRRRAAKAATGERLIGPPTEQPK